MSDAELAIRQFIYPNDYQAVYTLWSQAGPGIHVRVSDEPQEIEKKITRDPDLFLLAELGGRVIGSVLGGFDGRRGMMYHLAVAQEHRQRGVGDKLVSALEQRLREKGCIRYYLLVTRDNDQAIRFYEQRGWKLLDDLYAYAKDLV